MPEHVDEIEKEEEEEEEEEREEEEEEGDDEFDELFQAGDGELEGFEEDSQVQGKVHMGRGGFKWSNIQCVGVLC